MRYLSKSILLLVFGVVISCVIYPLVLWVIGQTLFPFQSNGSMLKGPDGKYVGSKLIAQPFTKDEYFQPRPSAASYDASASASSSLAASNYALRDRVARTLGPVVKYRSGPKEGNSLRRTSRAGSARKVPGQTGDCGPMGGPAQFPGPGVGKDGYGPQRLCGRMGKGQSQDSGPIHKGQSFHPRAEGARPGGRILQGFFGEKSRQVPDCRDQNGRRRKIGRRHLRVIDSVQ